MITCSFELKFVHFTSGEIVVYCVKLTDCPAKLNYLSYYLN